MNIETIFREEHQQLCKKANAWLKDYGRAEEAVQETYFKAIKYEPAFNKAKDYNMWVHSILFNTIKDVMKDIRNGGMVLEAKPKDFPVDVFEDILIDRFRLVELIEEWQVGDATKEMMNLHLILGYSAKDIAEYTGNTEGAVYGALHRFKKHIMEVI